MSEVKVNPSGGIGFFGVLFVVLFVLKVGVGKTAVVGWSWWWITSPLWAPICLVFSIVVLVLLVILFFLLGKFLYILVADKIEKTKKR